MLFWLSTQTTNNLSRQEAWGLQSLLDVAPTHAMQENDEDKYGIF